MNEAVDRDRRAPTLERELEQRHDFDRWRGVNRLEENVVVWRFFLGGAELPGWTVERVRRVELPDWPPAQRSVWRSRDEGGAVLVVETFECADRASAHDLLIRALAEYMTVDMRRDQESPLGDVAFVPPGETAVLFARANLVVRIHNGSPEIASIRGPAEALDRLVAERPATGREVAPRVTRLDAGTDVPVDVSVPLYLDAVDPLERPVWFKVHARGELTLTGEGPAYRATQLGTDVVTLYAFNENLRAGVATVEITASER